jgi:Xaa-Pro aminopeptidase
MISDKAVYENRIERLRGLMKNKGLDSFIVSIEENRRYISGFTGEDTQFDESAGVLVVCLDSLFLLTDSRFHEQAEKDAPLFETRIYRAGMFSVLAEIIREKNLVKTGFESSRMSVKQFRELESALTGSDKSEGMNNPGMNHNNYDSHNYCNTDFNLIPTEGLVEELRVIKDENEISEMRKALHISENVFKKMLPLIFTGVSEKEMAWELEKNLRMAGAEAMSFPVIAAAGPNASQPHAIPSDRRLQENECFLFDWGIKLNAYCSDITRTLFSGNPDDEFKRVFMTVFEAQQKAQNAIRSGVHGIDIDRIARDHIESSGYRGFFGHSLGHGVGMAIHESPRLSPVRDYVLEAGMVVTVEPGIYIPGWGGVRLENMVVVRQDGAEVLNSTSSLDFAHWL